MPPRACWGVSDNMGSRGWREDIRNSAELSLALLSVGQARRGQAMTMLLASRAGTGSCLSSSEGFSGGGRISPQERKSLS